MSPVEPRRPVPSTPRVALLVSPSTTATVMGGATVGPLTAHGHAGARTRAVDAGSAAVAPPGHPDGSGRQADAAGTEWPEGSALARFDRMVDEAFDHLRGNPLADAVAYGASYLGDNGLVWLALGAWQTRRRGGRRREAIRAVTFTAIATQAVSLGIKGGVGRSRPARGDAVDPHALRIPRTSSFPSGHALTSWCAATLLATDSPYAGVFYLLAGVISASRVHVRLHHASDVVGGTVIGIAMGRLGRTYARARRST